MFMSKNEIFEKKFDNLHWNLNVLAYRFDLLNK